MPVIAFGETANSCLRDGCKAADRPGLVRRLSCRIELGTRAFSFADFPGPFRNGFSLAETFAHHG